jgi:hypothetical protein
MDTLLAPRNPAWRHGPRVAAARRVRPAAPRRLGAAVMGAVRGSRRGHFQPAAHCPSLPRLTYGLI